VDDVVKVAGHRLSNIEIESALVAHPAVAEAATIGRDDPVKGQAVAAFVVLKSGNSPSDTLKQELKQWIAQKIGPIARPDDVFFSADLPKTRSAKIMRRLLRDIAEGRVMGDTTTLMDPKVMEDIKQSYIATGKEEA
jgi:acetyl-CoA synthetase